MLKTLDLQRNTTAILNNAYKIGYKKKVNKIWSLNFTMPGNDPKVEKIKMLQYVEYIEDGEYIGLYRIMPKHTVKNESDNSITYKCEHVLSTLLDSILFKYHQLTNYTTTQVLQYLIDKQKQNHWKLGTVAFTRYFHYSWENENLLSAIFSVPKPFDKQYQWTFDTQSYPWTLNLVKPETEPICRIKEGYNLKGLELEESPMSVYNRIYPLGAGEGVNQLGIESVNNGIPYIEDAVSIQENGIKETVWPDKRFEDAESLKASALSLLKKWKEPVATWNISAADISKITGLSIDKFKVGKVVRVQLNDYPNIDLRIMNEAKGDVKGSPGDIDLELNNLKEDLGTTNADLQRRQKINELYSQGATNILSFNYQDNCDSNIPAVIPFYLDEDVVNVNTCELTFSTKKFRAYSQATEGGGATVKSTSSGGGTTATSTSGGGTSKSTNSGGATTQSSTSAVPHRHLMLVDQGVENVSGTKRMFKGYGPALVNIETSNAGDLYTAGASGSHSHSVSIPSHTHNFTIPNHNHNVTIPNHNHEIELPNHIHAVKHEIIELDTLPSNVEIKVDGNIVPVSATSQDRLDLANYLNKDSSGKIIRGRHQVEISPDGLARIEADLILRVFIQSRLGGKF